MRRAVMRIGLRQDWSKSTNERIECRRLSSKPIQFRAKTPVQFRVVPELEVCPDSSHTSSDSIGVPKVPRC